MDPIDTTDIAIDPATQASQIADLFQKLSLGLDQYRAANTSLSPEQRQQFATNAQRLAGYSEQFTADAIGATLAGIQDNVANLISATKDAQQAIKTAAKIEKVASIAAAAITLGASIATGNPATILTSVTGLVKAVAPAPPADDPGSKQAAASGTGTS
jgi:hypothetical protein